ncbi:MAG: hypothetical protein WCJ01_07550 [Ignavibacteria bacterium]
MRLLKDKSNNYVSFYESLQSDGGEAPVSVVRGGSVASESAAGNLLEKYYYMVQNIMTFEKQMSASEDIFSVSTIFRTTLKRIIPLKESNLFFFNENKSQLLPFDSEMESDFTQMVNSVYKEGMLEWVFENLKPAVIPEVNNFTVSGTKLNYLFFPIIEDKKKKGLLSILSTLSKADFTDFESQSIQILLSVCLAKTDKLELKDKLNKTYSELQTYQAKLSNDFRLSAIGELTEGIVEDIKSPLQVILSCADMMAKDETDQMVAFRVKEQVKKINYVVNRLVKFSSINEEKIKIHSCGVNEIVTEYYDLTNSSLENANIECVLDFEKDLPPILSHPSYIFQLLSNIFSIIKASSPDGGGIIIQTRSVAESIVIKVINTAQITPLNSKENSLSKSLDLNVRIIGNIMKIHEGSIKIESFQKNSSVIVLNFPLRRRFR